MAMRTSISEEGQNEEQHQRDDLVSPPILNDEALVEALRWRFARAKTFTHCGRVLMSINPFCDVEPFSEKALERFEKGNEDANTPHIFNMCLKARKMRSITCRPQAFLLSGESGSGKTELARHIMRIFNASASDGKADPQGSALKSLTTILEAFGNAATVNNANASRFGLLTQFVPTGAGLTASSCTPLLLEQSRVSQAVRDDERNFHVFYQLLAGLSKEQKQDLCLLGTVEDYGKGYLNGAKNVRGINDAEQCQKLISALENIGVDESLRDELFRCLGGVLACGNIEWADDRCTNQSAMKLAATAFGVTPNMLERELSRDASGKAQSRTDSFTQALYGEVFSWLVRRASELMTEIPPNGASVAILDLPGFELLGQRNFLSQLIFNYAEECLQRLFLEKTVNVEHSALSTESVDMKGITFTDNSKVIDLLEGKGKSKGLFALLADQIDSESGSDAAFDSACRSSYAENSLFSAREGKANFTVVHTLRSVEYSTAGFRDTNIARLEPTLLKLLSESSSTLVRDIVANAETEAKRRGALADRSCRDLDQVLKQLGDGNTDLHFVKCIVPNRERRAYKEPASFDPQDVMSQIKGHGVFQVYELRSQIEQYPYRRTHSEFLADFGALVLGADWSSLRKNLKAGVESILKSELPDVLEKKEARVGAELVLLSADCLDKLKEKLEKPSKNLSAVAELVQQAVRGHAAGQEVAVAQRRLVSLQACVRRRLAVQKDLSKKAAQRQFYGVTRLLQAVNLFKTRRTSALTIAAHFRTAVTRQQSQGQLKQWRQQTLASLIQRCWNCSKARQHLQDLQTAGQDIDTVASMMESASLRMQLTKLITDGSAVTLQSFRRGLVAQREVGGMKEDQDAVVMLQTLTEVLLLRKSMSKELIDKSAVGLQSIFRGERGRAEAQDKAVARKDLQTLFSSFQTCLNRAQVTKMITEKSTTVFQKNRRMVNASRKVDDIREDTSSRAIISGMLETLQLRSKIESTRTNSIATNLQGMFRGKTDRKKVEVLKSDRSDWNIFSAMVMTHQLRNEVNRRQAQLACHMIQTHTRGFMARKRVNHLRFVHLQRTLSGMYHRMRAREFVKDMQEEEFLAENVRRVCSTLQAVAWRRQHVQRLEHSAVITVQRVTRGMIDRTRVRHIRFVGAQRTLMRVWRCFEAKQQFGRHCKTRNAQELYDVLISKLQTVQIRARLHAFKKHLKATSMIQRVIRGFLSRKLFKAVKWHSSAIRAKKLFHGILRRFAAIEYVYEEHADSHLDQQNTVYHCMLQTLTERMKFNDYSKQLYYAAAALKIQRVYRGWSTRRRPGIRMIKQAMDRVQLETRDRAIQHGHAAAALIQAIWRSWITRQVLLLPKVMNHLSLERNMIFEARMQDVATLDNLGYTADADRIAQISAGGCLVANMSVNYYGDLRKKSFRCWGQAVEQIENGGDSIIDMGVGNNHATIACGSGALYSYYQPEAFTDDDDETNDTGVILQELVFREALRNPAPRVTHVSCGDRHTLMMTDDGLLFTWGMNHRGQCGVGKHLPEKAYFSATCLQRWAIKRSGGTQASQTLESWSKLPRVKAIACGANHSACVDAKGMLWLWGEHQGIGMVNVRAAKSDGRSAPTFLLFRLSREIHKRHLQLERTAVADAQLSAIPLDGDRSKDTKAWQMQLEKNRERRNMRNQAAYNPQDDNDDGASQATSFNVSDGQKQMFKHLAAGFETADLGSVRTMFMEAQESCAIKEVVGDVLSPTKCCNIVLSCTSEAARLVAAGTPVLDCFIDGYCAPVFPAPARGAKFDQVGIGAGMNLALTDKGFIFTWGVPEKGCLGRPTAVPQKPSAPERLPFFLQLAISATQVSIGRDHVICLTTHGRVFTWGKVDACLGPSGFQRCTLEEPMFVEGVLREMRVAKVAAGRLESAIATQDFDVVLGWEMLEMSAVGHRLLPVAFQYSCAGPRSGISEANLTRMSMPQSDAVQFLLLGGPTSKVPHLHGLEPYPEDMTIQLGHHFTRRGEGLQKKDEFLRQRHKKPNNPGAAITELFQWAQRSCKSRSWTTTDPRLKRAAAVMVTTTFGARKRDALEVERDLSGFRRLALSRHDSVVMCVDSDCYKTEDYEFKEELGEDEVFLGGRTEDGSDEDKSAKGGSIEDLNMNRRGSSAASGPSTSGQRRGSRASISSGQNMSRVLVGNAERTQRSSILRR